MLTFSASKWKYWHQKCFWHDTLIMFLFYREGEREKGRVRKEMEREAKSAAILRLKCYPNVCNR